MEKIHGVCRIEIAVGHVQRALTRFDGLRLRVNGEECHLHRGKLSFHCDRRNLKFVWLPSGHSSWCVAGFSDVLPVEQTAWAWLLSWWWPSATLTISSCIGSGGLGLCPVLLHRLPVGNRVDETSSKQVSSTASALVSSACYLTGLLAHRRLDGSCRYDVRADRLLRGRCCRQGGLREC